MKGILNKYIAVFLIAVFAFFYCGNTIFVHTHQVGNVRIVHSHIPLTEKGTSHSHSDSSLKVISWFNLAVHSVETGIIACVPDRVEIIEDFTRCLKLVFVESEPRGSLLLRGPPQGNLRANQL